MKKKVSILVGDRFGRLVVTDIANVGTIKHPKHTCTCDCGVVVIVSRGGLHDGSTKSCGCLRKESATAASTTHGKSGLPEYKVWKSMNDRTGNPNNWAWDRYGGRGIKACDEWRSFDRFITDMGQRPSPNSQLDRIDNDLGYSKENCRWVTRKENMRNTSVNIVATFNGETKTVREWAETHGRSAAAVAGRLRRGWDMERALSTPESRSNKRPRNL
jgi:hypothetical protein